MKPAIELDSDGNPHITWFDENYTPIYVYTDLPFAGAPVSITSFPGKIETGLSTSAYCPGMPYYSTGNIMYLKWNGG